VAHWVVFCLDDGRYALPLSNTVRIVRAAEITPLPAAPPNVLGALNVAGNVLPVFNLRRRFGLPERALAPADHLLIARTGDRTVVLTIDVTSAGVCTVNNATVSFIGEGTCTIDANQGGDADFAPAPQMQQMVNVGLPAGDLIFRDGFDNP